MGTPFKMKGISPLKKGKVGMYGYVPHTKKIHKDPLVHQLSRQPENFHMSTRQLKQRAKVMRG